MHVTMKRKRKHSGSTTNIPNPGRMQFYSYHINTNSSFGTIIRVFFSNCKNYNEEFVVKTVGVRIDFLSFVSRCLISNGVNEVKARHVIFNHNSNG